MQALLLGPLVFLCAFVIDYAHAYYARARDEGRATAAANGSAMQWLAATVGFVVAVKVSLVVLPFEVAGLWCGTNLAVRRAQVPPICK